MFFSTGRLCRQRLFQPRNLYQIAYIKSQVRCPLFYSLEEVCVCLHVCTVISIKHHRFVLVWQRNRTGNNTKHASVIIFNNTHTRNYFSSNLLFLTESMPIILILYLHVLCGFKKYLYPPQGGILDIPMGKEVSKD